MSLINVQNFVAPLKNTTHVITLILVAGLFGSYRYAGGAISSSPRVKSSAPASVRQPIEDELTGEDTAAPAQPQARPVAQPATPDTRKKLLDEMMGKDSSKKDPAGGKEGLNNTLADIEKQLGLR